MSKQIILAKTAGFCFGVDRAVNLVYELVGEGKKVCTLGPIIHNAQLVADLESKGVKIIDDISQVPQGYTVVVRTHGVEKSLVIGIKAAGPAEALLIEFLVIFVLEFDRHFVPPLV